MNYNTGFCRVCNKVGMGESFSPKEMCLGTQEPFTYLLCPFCSSLYIKDIPDHLNHYYDNYPWKINSNHFDIKLKITKKHLKKLSLCKIKWLSNIAKLKLDSFNDLCITSLANIPISKSSTFLDIGCGAGNFLYDLVELGYKNATGLDPFLEKNITLQNGAQLVKASIDNFHSKQKFDIITLHHSFEHVQEPENVISFVKNNLALNGICIIRIPNIESFSFNYFKENWEGIHPPFHIFLPSQAGLKDMLKKHQLKITEIRPEQLAELFLFSLNRKQGICDFDENGSRKFLNDNPLRKQTPSNFNKNDIKYWKSIAKSLMHTLQTDLIAYYVQHA